jgi:hypothetical protein
MAKKKTAIPDNPSTTPATPRRRSPRKPIVGAVASAADMSIGPAPSASSVFAPSNEEIAEAAYHRYLSRGGEHGQDWNDWLEAERELRSRK